jgi:hypothetical protein
MNPHLKPRVQIFFSRATIPNPVLLFSNLSLGTNFLSSTVTVRARAKHLDEDSDSMHKDFCWDLIKKKKR